MAFSAVRLLYSFFTTALYLLLFCIRLTLTAAPTGKGIILYMLVSTRATGGGVGGGVPPPGLSFEQAASSKMISIENEYFFISANFNNPYFESKLVAC